MNGEPAEGIRYHQSGYAKNRGTRESPDAWRSAGAYDDGLIVRLKDLEVLGALLASPMYEAVMPTGPAVFPVKVTEQLNLFPLGIVHVIELNVTPPVPDAENVTDVSGIPVQVGL